MTVSRRSRLCFCVYLKSISVSLFLWSFKKFPVLCFSETRLSHWLRQQTSWPPIGESRCCSFSLYITIVPLNRNQLFEIVLICADFSTQRFFVDKTTFFKFCLLGLCGFHWIVIFIWVLFGAGLFLSEPNPGSTFRIHNHKNTCRTKTIPINTQTLQS